MATTHPLRTFRRALLALAVCPAFVAGQQPQTGGERAGFERPTSHAELIEFLYEVQAQSDHMLIEELTVTDQGRVMPIVYLGTPAPATPGAAWFSGKPTLFFTANVHGGERAGREGSLQLIRELALGELRPLLEQVNVLIVPTLNPDGSENGTRTNSLGYDMNRDFIVTEAPEIAAIHQKVLMQWWPDVYVDVHNGGAYPYNITYQATLHPAADADLVALARGPMYDAIRSHIGTHGMKTYWYSGPERQDNGEYIWRTTEPWARKQHTYGGLQNMITLLFEVPGRWTLEEQAANAREAMEGMIRYVADNSETVRRTVMEARRRAAAAPPERVVVKVVESAFPEPERFFVMQQGQAEPVEVTGRNGTLFVPGETRAWPWAYAFDGNLNIIADFLRRHAIEVERLETAMTADVEAYRLTSLDWSDEPYQNHLNAVAAVAVEPMSRELPAGTYIVRMSQSAARLIAQLFEPDTDDSLVVWNFLDHAIQAPEEGEQGDLLPMYRIPERVGVRATLVR